MDWLHFDRIYGPIKDIRVVTVADRAGIMIRLPRSTFPQSGSEPAHSEMTESSDVFAMYCMPDFQFLDVRGDTKDLEEESIFDDIGVHHRQFFVGSLNDESADEALDDHPYGNSTINSVQRQKPTGLQGLKIPDNYQRSPGSKQRRKERPHLQDKREPNSKKNSFKQKMIRGNTKNQSGQNLIEMD